MPSRFFRQVGGWDRTLACEYKEDGSMFFIRKNGYVEECTFRALDYWIDGVAEGRFEEFTPIGVLKQRELAK